MRYDKTIFFVLDGEKTYNSATGDYSSASPTKTGVKASVMDTGTQTMHLVYGEIRQGSKTIQIQNHYNGVFDRIQVGDLYYKVDYRRRLRVKDVFVVSEVL